MDLAAKVAVITGGSSGLGLATVEEFIRHGASVAIFDLNDIAAEAKQRFGDRIHFSSVNVTDEAMVTTAFEQTMAKFGRVDICINCAGVGSGTKTYGKSGPHPLADFRRVIDINLIGTFNVLRIAAQHMAQNTGNPEDNERGVIINTASVAAYEGQMGQAAYAASKAGVVGLTLPVARDLASYGIRVNTIVPGLINTPLFATLPQPVIDHLIDMVQFPKRLGKPEEYALLARQIVENPYINGESVRLDAAIRMQPR